MTLVILSPCIDVKDGACTEVCPVDCIYEGERMFYIHPDECIECGVCETICPVDAIRWDDEIPPGEEPFLGINSNPFQDENGNVRACGGWSRENDPLKDPEAVRNYSPAVQRTPQKL
ncbi:MAG: ferredoxin family protein [Rhodobacteraceae bacterium]|nr:ferredoxin family protein [Paracoccaceae bacterium]MCY4198098.1 ferredoxin family protein [Paracoccaceae bacterium]